ncbi:MAG: hypothetical protein WBX27_11490 [Specibacter sp.]
MNVFLTPDEGTPGAGEDQGANRTLRANLKRPAGTSGHDELEEILGGSRGGDAELVPQPSPQGAIGDDGVRVPPDSGQGLDEEGVEGFVERVLGHFPLSTTTDSSIRSSPWRARTVQIATAARSSLAAWRDVSAAAEESLAKGVPA